MPSHALHIVRYEDMAREPLRAFGEVAGFLGMRAGPERIARAVERSAFSVLQQQEVGAVLPRRRSRAGAAAFEP